MCMFDVGVHGVCNDKPRQLCATSSRLMQAVPQYHLSKHVAWAKAHPMRCKQISCTDTGRQHSGPATGTSVTRTARAGALPQGSRISTSAVAGACKRTNNGTCKRTSMCGYASQRNPKDSVCIYLRSYAYAGAQWDLFTIGGCRPACMQPNPITQLAAPCHISCHVARISCPRRTPYSHRSDTSVS